MRCRRRATPPVAGAVGIARSRRALRARCRAVAGLGRRATGRGLSRSRLPPQVDASTARGRRAVSSEAGTPHRRPLRKWLQERGVAAVAARRVPFHCVDGERAGRASRTSPSRASLPRAPDEPSWQHRAGATAGADRIGVPLPATFEVAGTPPDPLDCPPVVQFLRRWLP